MVIVSWKMRGAKITVGMHSPVYYSELKSNGSLIGKSRKSDDTELFLVWRGNNNLEKFKITVGYFPPKFKRNIVDSTAVHTNIDQKSSGNGVTIINNGGYTSKLVHNHHLEPQKIAKDSAIAHDFINEVWNDTNQSVAHENTNVSVASCSEVLYTNVRDLPTSEDKNPDNSTSNLSKAPKTTKLLDIFKAKVKLTQNLLRIKNYTSDFIPKLLEIEGSNECVEYTFDRLKTNPMIIHASEPGLSVSSSIEEPRANVINNQAPGSISCIANAKLMKLNTRHKECDDVLKDLDRGYRLSNHSELIQLKKDISSLCLTKSRSSDEFQSKTPKLWIKDSNRSCLRSHSPEKYPVGLRAIFNDPKNGITSTSA